MKKYIPLLTMIVLMACSAIAQNKTLTIDPNGNVKNTAPSIQFPQPVSAPNIPVGTTPVSVTNISSAIPSNTVVITDLTNYWFDCTLTNQGRIKQFQISTGTNVVVWPTNYNYNGASFTAGILFTNGGNMLLFPTNYTYFNTTNGFILAGQYWTVNVRSNGYAKVCWETNTYDGLQTLTWTVFQP